MKQTKHEQWKVVDEHGDTVITAESIDRDARVLRKTPKAIAQSEAKNLVNVQAGDRPVFAVKVGDTP